MKPEIRNLNGSYQKVRIFKIMLPLVLCNYAPLLLHHSFFTPTPSQCAPCSCHDILSLLCLAQRVRVRCHLPLWVSHVSGENSPLLKHYSGHFLFFFISRPKDPYMDSGTFFKKRKITRYLVARALLWKNENFLQTCRTIISCRSKTNYMNPFFVSWKLTQT